MSNDLPPVLPLVSTAADAFVAERDAAADAFAAERDTAEKLLAGRARIEAELAKVIVGQREVIEQIMLALLAGGHCLITGAPGLAKTLLVKSIAQVFHLEFRRIQFTPDLMPADITGTEILQDGEGGRKLTFVRGPVFGNMILADEINRTPPKTQAALLEAMQEHQVTAAGVRHVLAEPFFVLATQNPIEMEGTYPLPEAQLDRFLLKVVIDHPPISVEVELLHAYMRGFDPSDLDGAGVREVATATDLLAMSQHARKVRVADDLLNYIARIVSGTRQHPAVALGASPRASIALLLCAQVIAASEGRAYVVPDDVKELTRPVLRHRFLLHPDAELDGTTADAVIDAIVRDIPVPGGERA